MILCLGCKRLWRKGTAWCGTCRATLKCRICPDGHESPLYATCCKACGSTKLSRGVAAVSLRPIGWGIVALIFWRATAWLVDTATHVPVNLNGPYLYLVNIVLSRLIVLGLITWVCAWIFGERTAKTIAEFWFGLFRLLLQLIAALSRGLAKLFRK